MIFLKCFGICKKETNQISNKDSARNSDEDKEDIPFANKNNKFVSRIGEPIYQSDQTEVYKGLASNGKIYTVKKMKLPKSDVTEIICKNYIDYIERSKGLTHINLVRYEGATFNAKTNELYIFTEYIELEFEQLLRLIENNEGQVKFYIHQILNALKFLYDNQIHRIGNIKLSNFLVDNNGIIKIRDYLGNELLNQLKQLTETSKEFPKKSISAINKDMVDLKILLTNIIFDKCKKNKQSLDFLKILGDASDSYFPKYEKFINHPFLKNIEESHSKIERTLINRSETLALGKKRPENQFNTFKRDDHLSRKRDFNEVIRDPNQFMIKTPGTRARMLSQWGKIEQPEEMSNPKNFLRKLNSEQDEVLKKIDEILQHENRDHPNEINESRKSSNTQKTEKKIGSYEGNKNFKKEKRKNSDNVDGLSDSSDENQEKIELNKFSLSQSFHK